LQLDPLSQADDDKALDELLDDLGDWDLDAVAEFSPIAHDQADDEKEVSALLESIGEAPRPGRSMRNPEATGADHDDSEGEEMKREVENIVARARDDAELVCKAQAVAQHGDPPKPPDVGAADGDHGNGTTCLGNGDDTTAVETHDLTLPAVPSALPGPVPMVDAGAGAPLQSRKSLDFENDITTRMAALKGLGSGNDTDPFGLPSAPTFQPSDLPVRGLAGKPARGYTDDDQKTWCVVCLEDATIRCIGCDDDVYCARCWKDMHVGPSAGYEERGHQWVTFARHSRGGEI
jgi:hypothetical protein